MTEVDEMQSAGTRSSRRNGRSAHALRSRGNAALAATIATAPAWLLAVAHAEQPEPFVLDPTTFGEPVTWESFDAPLIGDVRALTSAEAGIRRAGEGYFSPDGGQMIFQAEMDETNPFFQIFMMDLATGEMHRVSPGTGKTTCSFFRPGTSEVLFASSHHDPEAVRKQEAEIEFRAVGGRRRGAWDYEPMMDIFVSRRDGSDLVNLSNTYGYDAEAAYSPDGSKIVFSSTRTGYVANADGSYAPVDENVPPENYGEIYIMNADGTDVRRLTEWPGYDGGPFFTPGGERIVWRHFDENGEIAEVYTMRLDGSDRLQLTNMGAMSWAPYFHPSGEYAIYTTNMHGFSNFELYIVDRLGEKEPVRVTDAEAFDGLPVFNPDGRHLTWTASRTANRQGQLFVGTWDHEGALAALQASPPRAASAERTGH
jgi:Tol biopolymer transport system component